MTPTAEEQASTSTHLAGRTTYITYTANTQQSSTSTHLAGRSTQTTHIANIQLQSLGITTFKPGGLGPHNNHPHPLISPGGQHKLHILLTYNYNPWASPPSNQEDWGHLQEDYTGGTPHLHTGGPRYLVIVIYIVSYIV